MEYLTKNGVIDLIVKNEIGYFERGIFEVRSFWKAASEVSKDSNREKHYCSVLNREIEIVLYPFETLYERFWYIGGCKHCKKIVYYPTPIDKEI